MQKFVATLATTLAIFVLPYILYGQQADAPVYKDGDWWRVKVQLQRPPGVSLTPDCRTRYSEYLVKMVAGGAKVFGLMGDEPQAINCSVIVANVAGRSEKDLGFPLRVDIEFPIHMGLTWSARHFLTITGLRGRWIDVQYEVQSMEKIKTPKGDFDAFKIVRNVPGGLIEARTGTWYYSPAIKAIISSREESPPDGSGYVATSTLVDFNVSQ